MKRNISLPSFEMALQQTEQHETMNNGLAVRGFSSEFNYA